MKRREFLSGVVAGAGLLTDAKDSFAQAPPAAQAPLTSGSQFDIWSTILDKKLASLPKEQGEHLLHANGVTSYDELKLQMLKRYATVPPPSIALDKLFNWNATGSDPTPYEKSPSHDKEAYDKGGTVTYDK